MEEEVGDSDLPLKTLPDASQRFQELCQSLNPLRIAACDATFLFFPLSLESGVCIRRYRTETSLRLIPTQLREIHHPARHAHTPDTPDTPANASLRRPSIFVTLFHNRFFKLSK